MAERAGAEQLQQRAWAAQLSDSAAIPLAERQYRTWPPRQLVSSAATAGGPIELRDAIRYIVDQQHAQR